MDIPTYNITEEYIDDPHWNSGYTEHTIHFADGLEIKTGSGKEGCSPEFVKRIYLAKKFELLWVKRGEAIRIEQFNEFIKKYENN